MIELDKLEKVIKGLECCTTMDDKGFPMCEKCPYSCEDTCPELDKMHRDALSLLKVQDPRVMTLEEVVKTERNTPIYIDLRYGMHGWDIYDGVDIQAKDIVTGARWASNEFWSWDEYRKTWRCWTSRPTDEQRKAVKWDEPSKEET